MLVFRLGWQVLRTRWTDALDRGRLRRALLVAVGAAVVVAAGLVLLQLGTDRLGGGPVAVGSTVVLGAAAAGALVFGCMPWASRVDPAATINGRAVRPDAQTIARGAVQLYVQRRPRPVRPEDRAAVLNDVPLLQRGLIRWIVRATALAGGLALVGLALITPDPPYPAMAAFVAYLAVPVESVVQLGRAERARSAALALPDGSHRA